MMLRKTDLDEELEELAAVPYWLAHYGDDIALAVYVRLQEHGALHRYVRPSISQLARESHHTRQTIYNALCRLLSYGAIRERRRPGGLTEWFCLLDVSKRHA